MIKSPLRYPGGKSKAIKLLYPLIKECDSFYEPFAGGASLGIYVSQTKEIPVYLNDLNYDVYSFWFAALNFNDNLAKKVVYYFNLPQTKETYSKIILETPTNEIERGARFFALNRITFSGTIEAGGYSNTAHKKRFTQSSIERMKKIQELSKKIQVQDKDYKDFLNINFSENAFVFLDPPYYSATKSALYGKNGVLHKEFSHEELFEFLKTSTSKFNFFMTYDNCDFIRNMYLKDFYVYEWKLQYGMTNKKVNENNELLISNYELKESELLKRVYSRDEKKLQESTHEVIA